MWGGGGPVQTTSEQSDLACTVYQDIFGRQLVFQILEHLRYVIQKHVCQTETLDFSHQKVISREVYASVPREIITVVRRLLNGNLMTW